MTNFFVNILFGFKTKSCIFADDVDVDALFAPWLSGSRREFGEHFPVLFEFDLDLVYFGRKI